MLNIPLTTGALCAQHPERAATATCERCGNFTCPECNLSGSSQLCPACRAIVGPQPFPLSRDSWSFDGLWSHAWEVFKRDWIIFSIVVLVFFGATFALAAMGSALQALVASQGAVAVIVIMMLTQVASFLVQGVLEMGAARVFLDALHGEKADIARMFTQVSKLGRYAVQRLLIVLCIGLPAVVYLGGVAGVAALVGGNLEDPSPAAIGIVVAGGLIGIGPFIYFLLPLAFATAELVHNEGVSAWTSIQNCFAIARGKRLSILGVGLLSGLLVIGGLLACCIGSLPAWALAQLLMMGLYLTLRIGSGASLVKVPEGQST